MLSDCHLASRCKAGATCLTDSCNACKKILNSHKIHVCINASISICDQTSKSLAGAARDPRQHMCWIITIFIPMSVACHEREEAPARQNCVCMYVCMYACTCVGMYVCTYACMCVCMHVGRSTRAPRRGDLCIHVLQEPRDGTARHTEDKARKKVWRCFVTALSCMQRTICDCQIQNREP